MSLTNQNQTDNLNPESYPDDYEQIFKFFEYSLDLLCIATFDGYFKKINPAVSKVLGYTEDELYNTPIMDFVHPDDRENTIAHRNSIINGGILVNHENRYQKKDGDFVWLSWTSVPHDNLKCVFAIAKNITKQKELEIEKSKIFDDLVNANKRLDHFAKIASHDLRAPIVNIMSLFDLIEEDKIKDQDSLDFFHLIKKSTERVQQTLEKYINDISNNEKTDEDQIQNIETITLDIIDYITDSQKLNEIKIITNFSAFNNVYFKKSYLESVIQNLITNAVKYSSPNRQLYIDISTRIFNKVKQLVISDNGLGMDMDLVRDRIFKMKQTFHSHKDSKGVGLYLVKSQLDEMNASIEVESEVNVGTKFIISFK